MNLDMRNPSDRLSAFLHMLKLVRCSGKVSEVGGSMTLISISGNRHGSPILLNWRSITSSVVLFDPHGGSGSDHPIIRLVAKGVPELTSPIASTLPSILEGVMHGSYHIEPILFGTTCWMYYLPRSLSTPGGTSKDEGSEGSEGRWLIGTRQCPDAGNASLRPGVPILTDAIVEALEAEGIRWEEMKEHLNPKFTYSFALHHHLIHIFRFPQFKMKIWLVGVFDPESGKSIPVEHADVMNYLPPSPPVLYRTSSIHQCQCRSDEKIGKDEMNSMSGDASDVVRKLCLLSSCSTPDVGKMVEGNPCMFGFIIRPTDPSEDGGDIKRHVVVKSPLYQYIDDHIGDLSPLRLTVARLLFAGAVDQGRFLSIFPQLSHIFHQAKSSLWSISSMVHSYRESLLAKARSNVQRRYGKRSGMNTREEVLYHSTSSVIRHIHQSIHRMLPIRSVEIEEISQIILRQGEPIRGLVISSIFSSLPVEYEIQRNEFNSSLSLCELNGVGGIHQKDHPILPPVPSDFPPLSEGHTRSGR